MQAGPLEDRRREGRGILFQGDTDPGPALPFSSCETSVTSVLSFLRGEMGIMMGPVHDVTAEIREHTMKSMRTGTQRELSLSRHMYVREAGADKRGAQLVFFSEGNFLDYHREVYSPDPTNE